MSKQPKSIQKDNTKKPSRPISGKQDYRNIPKARDCTPQLPRPHPDCNEPRSSNNKLTNPSHLSPTIKVEMKYEKDENVLIQTLSPRKLKYYEEKNTLIGWKEPKSTQHKEIELGANKSKEPNSYLRHQREIDIYTKSVIGGKKGPLYEAESQIGKHNKFSRQYYC